MRPPTQHLPALIELLNFDTKRGVILHSKSLVVHQQDLVALILIAQRGMLHPYGYAYHFAKYVNESLHPTPSELKAPFSPQVRTSASRSFRKLKSKLAQLLHERRICAAHLFYTADRRKWHLFYFDNRDVATDANHWRHGPHIHYISSLWPGLQLHAVWQQVMAGELGFPNKLHLRHSP